MPPFSLSQSIILAIHGLAAPFPWLSSSFCPIFVEPVHCSGYPWTGGAFPWLSGTFCPFFGELVHCSGHPWTGGAFPWLSGTFCPFFGEPVHRSSYPWTGADLLPSLWGLGPVHACIKCWGGLNTRKEAGSIPCLDKTYLLTIFPATRPKVIISAMAFPPRRLEP